MATPIRTNERVTVRDPRQLTSEQNWLFGAARGPWFVLAIDGVIARLGQSPLSTLTVVTPLSNLNRAGVTV